MVKITPEPQPSMPPADRAHALRPPPAPPMGVRNRRHIPIFTPYVVICTMFGALSVGYMAIAFTAPDWLEDLTPLSRTLDANGNPVLRPSDRLAADIGALRDSVSQLQSDMASVRSDVEASSARQANFETQIAMLDQRVAAGAPAAAPATPASAATPQLPKLINADGAATALETGSVAKPAASIAESELPPAAPQQTAAADIKFGPAIVKPAPKPMGIQISSGPTIEGLRVSWSLLSDNYGAELKKLQPRYATSGDPNNPTYELVAGPLKSKAEAIKVCKSLVSKSVPCTVTDYIGNAL